MGWSYDGGSYRDGRSLTHASCLDRHERTDLVLGYDPSPDARAAFTAATGIETAATIEAFFAAGLDLVAIASPSDLHFAHATKALQTGAHYVWLEKPPTLVIDDHRALIDLADRHRVRVSVNYPRRTMPQYAALADHARDGLMAVQIDYSRTLATNGVHMLDQLGMIFPQQIAPEPDWVVGTDSDNPSFGLRIGDVSITVNGIDLPYHWIDIRAITENGRISVRRGGLEAVIERRVENPDYPGFFHLAEAQPLVESAICAAAMRDGSYRNLANLVDDDADLVSSLETSLFAAEMMARLTDAAD